MAGDGVRISDRVKEELERLSHSGQTDAASLRLEAAMWKLKYAEEVEAHAETKSRLHAMQGKARLAAYLDEMNKGEEK